ncbi:methionine ABC transporter permease [Campylobacter sp. 19-13652]|uniref:methionine ABC transporter permease n=1 Tax=Campylobacter sp. 19-13652 TaxID=2840180 RepID=UPI001C75DB1A|nr:methionine ABC transporter permease [Campylobacter sp. 19-13652]BCX79620.1 ABC transporter permease [Campylobacter sp. 19-13652]
MVENIFNKFIQHFPQAILETFYMAIVSTTVAFIIGLGLAVVLFMTSKNGLKPHPKIYQILDIATNTLRSFPFIILIVAIDPFTRLIAGSSIGTTAIIVPLTIGTAPFLARLIEASFNEVDKGLIEAARSYGATDLQIVFRVVFIEALPSIVSNLTLTLIVVVGFSAMAGVVGGGGVGAVAINRGYNGFDDEILYIAVVVLLIIVQIFQSGGNFLYKLTKK